jgi:hypothetical protein
MLHRNRLTPNPDARPPAEVRFTELRVEPWPDGRRVRVHVSLTPFQQNPNLEAVIHDHQHQEMARASIVEAADPRFVFTLHIRAQAVGGTYSLTANLSYPDLGSVDERSFSFETRVEPGYEENG